MKIKLTSLIAVGILSCSTAFSQNVPLLENTDMSSYDKWVIGGNVYTGSTWSGWRFAPQDFTFAEQAGPEGDGIRMLSWDDNESDRIEMFFQQEHLAGPPGGGFASELFSAGDKIVFKGSASSVKNDVGEQNMITRAYIKFLGYKEVAPGVVDPNQTYGEFTVYHNIGPTLEPFEISTVYPDVVNGTPITEDNPLTKVQVGFEIATVYDSTSQVMDSGSIYAENIEAYIEGTQAATWNGYDIGQDGWVDTGSWMGMVNVNSDPWIWVLSLDQYIYIPTGSVDSAGAWVYAVSP